MKTKVFVTVEVETTTIPTYGELLRINQCIKREIHFFLQRPYVPRILNEKLDLRDLITISAIHDDEPISEDS